MKRQMHCQKVSITKNHKEVKICIWEIDIIGVEVTAETKANAETVNSMSRKSTIGE